MVVCLAMGSVIDERDMVSREDERNNVNAKRSSSSILVVTSTDKAQGIIGRQLVIGRTPFNNNQRQG
jgi:hypothetical protein